MFGAPIAYARKQWANAKGTMQDTATILTSSAERTANATCVAKFPKR